MIIQITRWKETGKFYDVIEAIVPNTNYWNENALEVVRFNCRGWEGYATVSEVQADGFEQPMRLLTKDELK